jgi:hypothetical protein
MGDANFQCERSFSSGEPAETPLTDRNQICRGTKFIVIALGISFAQCGEAAASVFYFFLNFSKPSTARTRRPICKLDDPNDAVSYNEVLLGGGALLPNFILGSGLPCTPHFIPKILFPSQIKKNYILMLRDRQKVSEYRPYKIEESI